MKEIVYKVIAFLKNPFGGGNTVIEEVFEGDVDVKDDRQLWKKGQPIENEYFTLEVKSHKGPKFLTANSKGGLEIRGNFG